MTTDYTVEKFIEYTNGLREALPEFQETVALRGYPLPFTVVVEVNFDGPTIVERLGFLSLGTILMSEGKTEVDEEVSEANFAALVTGMLRGLTGRQGSGLTVVHNGPDGEEMVANFRTAAGETYPGGMVLVPVIQDKVGELIHTDVCKLIESCPELWVQLRGDMAPIAAIGTEEEWQATARNFIITPEGDVEAGREAIEASV